MQVHLLNDDRGPVIEALVARTQRQVSKEGKEAMNPEVCHSPCACVVLLVSQWFSSMSLWYTPIHHPR